MQARRLLSVLAIIATFAPGPARAVTEGLTGSYTHTSPAYSITLRWAPALDGTMITGTIMAAERTAAFSQSIFTMAGSRATGPAPLLVIESSRSTAPEGHPSLHLQLGSPVGEFSGRVDFTFLDDEIRHRSEFIVPEGLLAPRVQSVTTVEWTEDFGLFGTATANGTIEMFDDGTSLDRFGEWRDVNRYGVFTTDPGGAFAGHGRLAQGDLANFIEDGSMRVGRNRTQVISHFTGFLAYPSLGLDPGLWTLDAIAFPPAGSTAGAYADRLAAYGAKLPPADPGDLTQQGLSVIAVADTGVNPYHEDFVNPAMTAHPSTYLTGYPADTQALNLTFGTGYAAARTADDESVWATVEPETLYWIPGTKIVGAYSIGSSPGSVLSGDWPYPERRIIDDDGHGTGTASVAAGYHHGSCPECLLVVIEGTTAGVMWAASQPWIDVLSNSWGEIAGLPLGTHAPASRAAYGAGKTVFFSSGNGISGAGIAPDRSSSMTRTSSGPSWVIPVGAASPKNDRPTTWHSIPAAVVSYGTDYPAAAHDSASGEQIFGGTSCATPIAAGVYASLLASARTLAGDTDEGTDDGILAEATTTSLPSGGPLADGIVTRDELVDVLYKTAIAPDTGLSGPINLGTMPGVPGSYIWAGYGLVNAASRAHGLRVIAGSAPLPERPDEDRWWAAVQTMRLLIWGAP